MAASRTEMAASRSRQDIADGRLPLAALLIQATIPWYRVEPYRELASRLGGDFAVAAGSEYFDPTVTLAPTPGVPLVLVRNTFLVRRRILWQSGVIRHALRADLVIAELNPRMLSTWVVLVARRLLGRPTILWGHAWPRRGRRSSSDRVRQLMRRLPDAIVAYSETEAAELRARMPGRRVLAAPNSLYHHAQRPLQVDAGRMDDFLFVGRLVDAKKPGLLLDAFLAAVDRLPAETNLVFVGDGPLEPALRRRAERSPARDRIRFPGKLTDLDGLAPVYGDALATVIPGYAGLSVIQSLWFGVPTLIARDEPHSPEIEAAAPPENAVFFESDSVEALSLALIRVAAERAAWIERRERIAADCARTYSIEAMVDSIESLVRGVAR
jgi:glycosyltransferase involved in cell wall biosynthesis